MNCLLKVISQEKNRARYLYLSPKPKKLKYKYRESLTDQVKSEIDMLN